MVVPHNAAHFLQGRDVIWYVDNQTACQHLIKYTSSVHDLSILAAVTQLLLTRLSCRVYWEYVESEANPVDELSRDGLRDAWTLAQNWELLQAQLPALLNTAFDSLTEALLLV